MGEQISTRIEIQRNGVAIVSVRRDGEGVDFADSLASAYGALEDAWAALDGVDLG